MNAILSLGLLTAGLVSAPLLTAQSAPTEGDIVDVAAEAGSFKTLLAAAKAGGLVDALKGDGPLTVFAPTDDAFAKLGSDTIKSLLKPENKDRLVEILTYHVVVGKVTASDALGVKNAEALSGGNLSFALSGGQLKINGEVNVVANDVAASNGIIHVIDRVLIPAEKAPEGRLVIGFYSEKPGSELADYLGVDRNECVLVSRVTKGGEAERAGLLALDLIVGINGKPVTAKTIAKCKEQAGFGGTIALDVLRRGKPLHIESSVGIETH